MSDLSLQLQQATGQLPVSSYFDAALHQREMQTLFQRGPRYVGHTASVPNVGDYATLANEGEGRALLRTPSGIELISNVCRHRQAIMLKGRGTLPGASAGNIVCPIHRWTYSAGDSAGQLPAGTLMGAPHFPTDPCLNLHNYPLREWNGLLFEDNGRDVAADLAGLGEQAALDFAGYVLDKTELHECNYNWKTFIEVYLEDYHVGPFHPGLGHFVTCDDLRWEFGEQFSVQTVGRLQGLWQGRHRRCTSAGTMRCSSTATARCLSAARSGSPITRTSWSSGTRMCSRSPPCTRWGQTRR